MAARPNFFVIGASKSGSSSLCELLGNHPDVFFSVPKEPFYFSEGERRGFTEAWYLSLFDGAEGFRAVGEGTTNYAVVGLNPGVAERIEAFSPGYRAIYIVRHPPERIESQWIQLRTGDEASESFVQAIREVPEMVEGNLYWKNISSFRRVISDERILVLFFDEFRADPQAQVRRCFRFLGLDPEVPLDAPDRPRNPRGAKREELGLLKALRRVPGFESVRDAFVPPAVRPRIRRFLTRPITSSPRWDEASYRWIVERIREDNLRFLEHYGKPADYWRYDLDWVRERMRDRDPSAARPVRGA